MQLDRQQWISHLDIVAGRAVPGSLGLGPMDAAFDAAVSGTVAHAPRDCVNEIALWWARCDPGVDVAAVLGTRRDGPLLSVDRYQAIEVWTDAELSAVHALWWLVRAGRADERRLHAARDWHLEHTQPDNATNRPWAIHVFAEAGTPEHEHYAQTLLHDALVMDGRPSALAGAILRDAAAALRAS